MAKTTAAKTAKPTRKKAKPMDHVAIKDEERTLSLRVGNDKYRRLRSYILSVEQKTGERLSHQAVLDAGLEEYLKKRGA